MEIRRGTFQDFEKVVELLRLVFPRTSGDTTSASCALTPSSIPGMCGWLQTEKKWFPVSSFFGGFSLMVNGCFRAAGLPM